ncbi:tetratricopeptide repeat protein [Shewanella maritima]|uniref:Tetratricopeptide repeat protein n=2 Tax=Shewanella maritima TaxID=2520507 RepID=A0A411PDR0_9GAMM|nr:tetratricopeptide repeat protein [Shewanella maritima]
MRICFLLIGLMLSVMVNIVNANSLEQLEIQFREHPQQLYQTLLNKTQYPLIINNKQDLQQAAAVTGMSAPELHQNLVTLARLTLETSVASKNKYQQAQTLLNQLDVLAQSNLDQAMVLMLQARYKARRHQEYKTAISEFNEALTKVASESSPQATLFRYIVHEQLSSLNHLIYRPVPALSHLNHFRDIAYQLRNEYFISLAESALGKYYSRNDDKAKSLQHYSEAFRISNRLQYKALQAGTQLSLARTYRDLEQWDDALKYGHDAVATYQGLNRLSYVAQALSAIAITYKGKQEWHKAIDYYLNSEQVNRQLNNEIALGINFHNLGEAYAEIGDIQASLTSLQKANEVFRSRKLNHYLVHNELLFAKVTANENMWSATINHAQEALKLATLQSLDKETLEALEYLAKAYKNTGQLDKAIAVFEQMIVVDDRMESVAQNKDSTSDLTVQKLKFELGLIKNQLDEQAAHKKRNQLRLVGLLITTVLFFLAFVITLKRQRSVARKLTQLESEQQRDPITQVKGYQGLVNKLGAASDSQAQRTLSLVNVRALNNDDLNLGLTESNAKTQQFVDQLEHLLPVSAYIIRPGVIACYFNSRHLPEQILTAIEQALSRVKEQQAIPRFQEQESNQMIALGHVHLPLLDNPDVYVSPQLQIEAVQFALAAASTIGLPKSYISLKTLNFAPAAIFAAPLYLNLNQALSRGIIRAESNHDLDKVNWPKLKVRNESLIESQ